MQAETKTPKQPHNVILENRKKISITGVLDVDSFDENVVTLLTEIGILIVKGEDLHINRLNVESGDVSVEGVIYSLAYSDEQKKAEKGLVSRLFK